MSLFIYLCGSIGMCILPKYLKINISLPESHQKALKKVLKLKFELVKNYLIIRSMTIFPVTLKNTQLWS